MSRAAIALPRNQQLAEDLNVAFPLTGWVTDTEHIPALHSNNSDNLADRPLLPTRAQRDYLAKRVRDEINRNRGVVSAEALEEFEDALRTFEGLPALGE